MLPTFEKDKANHIIYGVLIYGLAAMLITNIFSLIAVLVTAVGKEFYDYYKGKPFSYADIMATQFGGIIAFIISIT